MPSMECKEKEEKKGKGGIEDKGGVESRKIPIHGNVGHEKLFPDHFTHKF